MRGASESKQRQPNASKSNQKVLKKESVAHEKPAKTEKTKSIACFSLVFAACNSFHLIILEKVKYLLQDIILMKH